MTDNYKKFPGGDMLLKYFELGGVGVTEAHTVVTDTAPFVGNQDYFVYAIVPYTDEAEFTTLKENGIHVDAVRLDAGGVGYPAGIVIPGKFTTITPAAGSVFGVYVVNVRTI